MGETDAGIPKFIIYFGKKRKRGRGFDWLETAARSSGWLDCTRLNVCCFKCSSSRQTLLTSPKCGEKEEEKESRLSLPLGMGREE